MTNAETKAVADRAADRICAMFGTMDHYHGALSDVVSQAIAESRSAPPHPETSATKEALAWAYQFAGARGACAEALDNLSALSHGNNPPHEWPVVLPAPPQEGMREALETFVYWSERIADLAGSEWASETPMPGWSLSQACHWMNESRKAGIAALAAPHVPTSSRPALSCEYIGEELAIFWQSPYGHGKEKIASFWWPFHPAEATAEVEATFEAIAQATVAAWNAPVPTPDTITAAVLAEREACAKIAEEVYWEWSGHENNWLCARISERIRARTWLCVTPNALRSRLANPAMPCRHHRPLLELVRALVAERSNEYPSVEDELRDATDAAIRAFLEER